MAKVGFWLHGARGKLAGSSLRRGTDGKTIISEIVTPFNPRTNSQLFQRAIMATIMRAYSAGKEVFDHSFQGKSVGAANMATFMKHNLRILRNLCAEEIDVLPWIHWGGAVVLPNCRARLVHYESLDPVGFDGMMISSGSYDQNFFKVTDAWAEFTEEEHLSFTIPAALANETCAEYALRTSLVADDLYTICGFYPSGGFDWSSYYWDEWTWCGVQKNYSFFIIRMHVRPEFVASSDPIANKKLKDIFLFEAPIGQFIINDILLEKSVGDSFWMGDFYENFEIPSDENAWCNIIRSRVNEDLRSTTVLKQNCAWANVGIIPAYVLPVWYPDIKGEPYPNPPIPPHVPFVPTLFYRPTSGNYLLVNGDGKVVMISSLIFRRTGNNTYECVNPSGFPFPGWGVQMYQIETPGVLIVDSSIYEISTGTLAPGNTLTITPDQEEWSE